MGKKGAGGGRKQTHCVMINFVVADVPDARIETRRQTRAGQDKKGSGQLALPEKAGAVMPSSDWSFA
jgi:hypothetical protein